MVRVLGVLCVVAVLAGMAAFSRTGGPARAQVVSCDNFPVQVLAQTFLKAVGEDPGQMDGPNDNGVACEELPCPCDDEPIPELIGDVPATSTPTNTPWSTRQTAASPKNTPTPVSTPSTANSAAATATPSPSAVTAPPATQGVITPPSTGDGGLR